LNESANDVVVAELHPSTNGNWDALAPNSLLLRFLLLKEPLLKSEWAVWRVEGGREPGAANP
jgi:hypothetical protein